MPTPRNLNRSLGNVQSIGQSAHGVKIHTEHGIAELTVFEKNIVRVRIRKIDQTPEPHSYAVISKPVPGSFEIQTLEDHYLFSNGEIFIKIEKSPFRLVFCNANEDILNEDDPFSTSWIGDQVTTYKKLQDGERFIGLGEKNGPLDRRGTAYVNWNTDAFAYGPDDDPLYLTTPFYMGLHQGLSYGIFFDNSHRTTFSFGASSRRFSWFSAEGGEMDYYFFAGDVSQIIQSYTWLTGSMPLPPKWSLGYQQCRYSYYPDTEVRSLARTFREKKIPCDVIYLDIHYMDGYRVFTFHPERFPEPERLVQEMKEAGFRLAIIMDPGIKVDENYKTYTRGLEGKHYVTYPDGTPYEGEVWPGWSAFPDFTDPATRTWWQEESKYYTQMGISGLWNDMNEPAAWGNQIPNNLEFSWEGEKATHLQAHNVYGMQMARATREAADQQLPHRPFILTRAGYSGIQRYAAVWTGDNVASDEHMMGGVRLLASMGLTGMPFTGYDVGAFVGECTPQLFARWMQLGVFSAFFRGHSMVNSRDSEPWSYGEQYEEISRNYIGLRYKLMPYIVSCMYLAHHTGMPLVRSLAIDHTWDEHIYNPDYQNQYLFGPSILVIPVESTKDLKKAYLPQGKWYDLFTDDVFEGKQEVILETDIEKLPLFAKGGTVIPMQSVVQHTGEVPADRTLFLHVYAGEGETYKQELYDDQDQHHPEEDQQFWKRELSFSPKENQLLFGANQGEWDIPLDKLVIHFHGYEKVEGITLNGSSQKTTFEDIRLVEPISKFDPFGPEKGRVMEAKAVATLTISAQHDQKLLIKW